MANKSSSLSSAKRVCKYHIVFSAKYMRKIIYGQYNESIKEIVQWLSGFKGVDIMFGHLHLLLSIPLKLSVFQSVWSLKNISALTIFAKACKLEV